MSVAAEQESNSAYYGGPGSGGFGMMGGLIAMVILIVVVLWLLFRDGHRDGHHDGYVYGGFPGFVLPGQGQNHDRECGVCVKDESNWQEDKHLTKEICEADKDVWKTACETQKNTICEEEKTRALIVHNQERSDDKANLALVLQLQQKDNQIQTLQLENSFNNKLACLGNEISKGFCKTDFELERGFCKTDREVERGFCRTDREIEKFSCETPKRPTYWGQGFIDDGFAIPPRRGHKECASY